jgi:YidC/Oxa1 family membrane protein insertase
VDKKTIIILVPLVLAIIFYWQILEFLGVVKPKPAAPPKATADTIQVKTDSAKPATAAPVVPIDTTVASVAAPVNLLAPSDTIKPESLTVRTKVYTAILSSVGGGPVSLKLNEFKMRDGSPIEILVDNKSATPEVTFAGGTVSSSKFGYKCSLPAGTVDATSRTIDVSYTYTSPEGGQLIRSYRFYPDSTHYNFVVEVRNREQLGFDRHYSLVWNNPLGVTEPQPSTDYDAMEAVAMMAGSCEKLTDFKNNKLNQSLTGTTTWAAVRNKYFAAVMIPLNKTADGATATGQEIPRVSAEFGKYLEKQFNIGLDLPIAGAAAFADTFNIFVGPLDYTLLADYNNGMQDILGIGTTPYVGWIIKPFAIGVIWLLPRMFGLFHNYGLVIILFALLVKLITLPLSLKSMRSMNAMKELQPKIEELKKRLKNKPQDLNAETMRLYKEHGVNPLSGCFPMLAQMPLFFALFSVFRSTILLRNAPFVWFITDLSRGAVGLLDPYMSLVVLMVVFQFVSQILSMPSNQQNKFMYYLMPLIFAVFFYKLAAGLVLYWTCFSLFTIGDYYIFRRQKKNEEVKTL